MRSFLRMSENQIEMLALKFLHIFTNRKINAQRAIEKECVVLSIEILNYS